MPGLSRKDARKLQYSLRRSTFVPQRGILEGLGQETLPSGKHKGLTFKQSFLKDMPYAAYMARKTTLTSAWAPSYQNFAVAKFKSMAKAKLEKESQDKKEITKEKTKGGYPETKETTDTTLEDDGRKLRLTEGAMTASSSTAGLMPRARTSKHSTEPDKNMAMKDDVMADQHLEIRTRKALLRRTGAVGADFREDRDVSETEVVCLGQGSGGDLFNVAELCQKIDGRILSNRGAVG